MAVRTIGVPSLEIWDLLMQPKRCVVELMEDNTATMQIIETGRNPSLRHINRTQKVSVSWLHDVFDHVMSEQIKMTYCPTKEQKAGIFTKAFSDAADWTHACELIGILLPADIARHRDQPQEAASAPAPPQACGA